MAKWIRLPDLNIAIISQSHYIAQSLSLPDIDSARKWIGVEGLNLFPSRYTANPRRPLLRVIPPTYKKQYPVAEYIILKNLSTRYLLFRYDLLRVLRRQTEQ